MTKLFILFLFLSTQVHSAPKSDGFSYRRLAVGKNSFRIAEVDLKKYDLKLYWKKADGTPYISIDALRSELGEKFVMATNSGIYSLKDTPTGLHIENGETLAPLNKTKTTKSKGNFYLIPNGVFALTDEGPKIFETFAYLAADPHSKYATQSGPLLLDHGKVHPKFHQEKNNRKLRSGVGVNDQGAVVFAISENYVTFTEFALLFRNKLHCSSALYLDGSISTMVVKDEAPFQPKKFVGIWAVTTKN